MNKYRWVAVASVLLSAVIVATLVSSFTFEKKEEKALVSKKPNIVLILADDLGYGDVGAFGAADIKTPNIDALASNGLKLTEFYSPSPVCSPTRFGIMTGRFPRRAGIDHVFFPESYNGIPKQEVTIAEALRKQGYATGIVGKWHLGHHYDYLPLQNGFDSYYGIPYSNDMSGVVYLKNNSVDSFNVNQKYITQTYTAEAIRFIENNKSKPFFLYLAHNMPHVPLYASPAFEGKSKRGLYGDVVEEIDWSVGKVVEALKKSGLEENTLIVFTSDNGPWLIFDVEGGSAGPLRQGKGSTFEGGQRVPGIVYWPGKVKPGTVYNDLVAQLDLFPTFITLAGGNADNPVNALDGEDVSQVFLGTGKRKGNEYAYYSQGKLEAFRKGDWKIRLPHPQVITRGFVSLEATDTLLFNLKTDVGEKNNLIKSNPAKAKELLAAMKAYEQRIGATPPRLVQQLPADNSHIKKYQERHPERNLLGNN